MNRFFFLIFALFFLIGCNQQDPDKKAKQLHGQILTIDSHTDTPLWLMQDDFDLLHGDANGRAKVSLKRMEEGGLDAAFFAVYLAQGPRTPAHYEDIYRKTKTIFDSVHANTSRFRQHVQLALTSDDIHKIKQQGKRAIYLGVENGYPIGTDIDKVDSLYHWGTRYLTLCHTKNNDICDSSTDKAGAEHNGLSPFGTEVINRLNRIGMIVDVSHISDSAFFQTLKITQTPILASHSNARAICDNPRNLTDEMLLALQANGGVVQVCLLGSYVKPEEPNPQRDSAYLALNEKYGHIENMDDETHKQLIADWYAIEENYPLQLPTVADLVDHIDYIVQLIGIDHVGIGSDFDGGGALTDCMHAGEIENITRELIRRGYSNDDIKKIWGENLLRVFKEVESFARQNASAIL